MILNSSKDVVKKQVADRFHYDSSHSHSDVITFQTPTNKRLRVVTEYMDVDEVRIKKLKLHEVTGTPGDVMVSGSQGHVTWHHLSTENLRDVDTTTHSVDNTDQTVLLWDVTKFKWKPSELPVFTDTAKGLVPTPDEVDGNTKFLRQDGTWVVPSGGGGSNLVTTDTTQTITGVKTFGSAIVGDLTGDVTGNVTGDLTGNVTGDVTGDLTGNATGNVTGNLTGNVTGDVTGDLTGNVTGNVAGNLTGNVTGDVTGDLTGDADSATKLKTARTIGGVSFDGTANIDLPGVNTVGNQDTSGNSGSATQLETARTIGGVSFDGLTNINLPGVNIMGNQSTSGNAATASKLAASKKIGGVDFDGSSDVDLPGVNTAGSQDTSGKAATSGNADTVTDGVYTEGAQTVNGEKSFTGDTTIGPSDKPRLKIQPNESGNESSYTAHIKVNGDGLEIGHNSQSRQIYLQPGDNTRLTMWSNGNVLQRGSDTYLRHYWQHSGSGGHLWAMGDSADLLGNHRMYFNNAGAFFWYHDGGYRLKQTATALSPYETNAYSLGTSSYYFSDAFSYAWSLFSDRRAKKDIVDTTLGLEFVKSVRAVEFTWKEGNSGRRHQGFIAQELRDALDATDGVTASEQAMWCDSSVTGEATVESFPDEPDKVTPKPDLQCIRPTELISVLVKAVQELSVKNDALEARLTAAGI